jgi:pimeloyl-ACP methyl ester carboxylesterase
MNKNQLQLLRTRRFLPLFLTRSLGAFNDNLCKNAIVFLATFGTGSRAEGAENLAMRCWEDRDVVLWSVNPPGYGNSGGRASLRNISTMATATAERIRDAAGERPVTAEGFSLGCVAALFLSAQGHVAGLILRNPPPLREVARHRTGWWGLGLLPALIAAGIPETADSVSNAAACRVPALFFTALRDQVVPANCQQLILDGWAPSIRPS